MKTTIIIPIMLMLATLACKEEEIASKDFIVGEENNSKINTYNPPIHLNTFNNIFQIDIDADQNNDISLMSIFQRYPGGGGSKALFVEILNPKLSIAIDSVASIVMKDTSVFCIDTVENSTCTDSLYLFYPTPKVYSFGDRLDTMQIWYNGSFLFLCSFDNSDYHSYPHPVIRESGVWNNINHKYMIFSIEQNDCIKFGWVKISVEDFYVLDVYEYYY
jgi:hypothetical protein